MSGHHQIMVIRAPFPAMVRQRQSAHTVLLTGLPDGSALYGVLAEIEPLGLDLVEVRQPTTAPANHQNQVTARSP